MLTSETQVILICLVGLLVVAIITQSWMMIRAASRSVTAAGALLHSQREDAKLEQHATWRRAEEEKEAMRKELDRAYAALRRAKSPVVAQRSEVEPPMSFDTPRRPMRPPRENGMRPGVGADSPVGGAV